MSYTNSSPRNHTTHISGESKGCETGSKPIEIPIAILSRATPKVIATPTPMLIP